MNLGGDPSQDYFSDGLSEELRATLARNLGLRVMAQASSSRFRDRKDDAKTIAAKLGVAYLLDGSVRRSGNVLRITADLIEGASGFSRWSQTFDRVMQDIFAIQSEIADTVARALVARVADDDAGPQAGAACRAAGRGGLDEQRRGLRRLSARPRAIRPQRRRDLGTRRARPVRRGDRGRSRLRRRPCRAGAFADRHREPVRRSGRAARALRRRHRRGPSRHRACARLRGGLLDARLHAVPGPPGCARGARALRALAGTGVGRGDGHGALRAVQRARGARCRGR